MVNEMDFPVTLFIVFRFLQYCHIPSAYHNQFVVSTVHTAAKDWNPIILHGTQAPIILRFAKTQTRMTEVNCACGK